MKRSVAITGPTPAFLRWAIWQSCDLRLLDPYQFPDQTFRTLRGIHELSIAKVENRCTDSFCFHPTALAADDGHNDEVRGFQRSEIAAAFGGEAVIEANCGGCPANAAAQRQPEATAGCFGFLSSTEFDLQRLLSGHPQDLLSPYDLISTVQASAERLAVLQQVAQRFGTGGSVWHRLWKPKILAREKLNLIGEIFKDVVACFLEQRPQQLVAFCDAVDACLENDLSLHVQLVPAGVSDGQTWTLNPCCPDCGYEPGEVKKNQRCLGCNRAGGISGGRKFRVLGLRPYGNLSTIVAPEQIRAHLQQVRQS